MNDLQRYDSRTILLHWLTAAAVASLWVLGQVIDFFPSNIRVAVRSTHVLIGILLVVLFVVRLAWRRNGGRKLPPSDPGALGKAAIGVHHLLYLLLAAALALGLANEAIRADNIFYLGRLPSIAPGDKDLRHLVEDLHALAANWILIVAGLHAAAALFHHFVKKDGVLLRMK
jgi:cytochrome b561